eukprot:gene7413-8201_t
MATRKPLPRELEEDLAKVKAFRHGSENQRSNAENLSKAFDDSRERAIFDEVFGSVRKPVTSESLLLLPKIPNTAAAGGVVGGSSSNPTQPGLPSAKSGGGSDFTTSLLQRLRLVEAEAKEARDKLAEQIVKNDKLEREVTLLKTMVTHDPQVAFNEVETLRKENKQLQEQVEEMEEFLSDYGLIWVGKHGNKGTAATNTEGEEGEGEGEGIDYTDFAQAIQRLNDSIHNEPAKIQLTNAQGNGIRRGRIIQASEAVSRIRLAFYRDGLLIQRGPFRSRGSSGYQSFVQDILDGYFPSEFHADYPDGVLFDLVDKHDIDYAEALAQGDDGDRLSNQQLLNHLPNKKITKDGVIVDVRSEIAQRLGSNGNNGQGGGNKGGKVGTVIETEATHALPDSEETKSLGGIATVQVKWTDGRSFVARLFALSTIQQLKEYILRHVEGADHRPLNQLELRCIHPMKSLSDRMTIQEANLLPNGTVHARIIT